MRFRVWVILIGFRGGLGLRVWVILIGSSDLNMVTITILLVVVMVTNALFLLIRLKCFCYIDLAVIAVVIFCHLLHVCPCADVFAC